MSGVELSKTPEPRMIDPIAQAFEQNPYVQGLRRVGASDEVLRITGEVLMGHALDSLGVERPDPKPTVAQRIGRFLHMTS